MEFNFNNKTFSLIENSIEGEASKATKFKYKQKGNLVTAVYNGGNVRFGSIIAILEGSQLHMRYQCITENDELKSGKAVADLILTDNRKIRMHLTWEWIDREQIRGTSIYIEQ